MSPQRLTREHGMNPGKVFMVMPYGVKPDAQGRPFDYDQMYQGVLVPTVAQAGMSMQRADAMHGGDTVIEPVWRGIQQAEIVLIVFSPASTNVSLEFAMAYLIGKKMIYLTQDSDDLPSDVRGLRTIRYSSNFADMNRMRDELLAALETMREEPSAEMMLVPMPTTGATPAPGMVVSATEDHAVIRTDDGRHGVLSASDVDYARIIHDMSAKFPRGTRVNGSFHVSAQGDMRYTLLAGETNPWPALVSAYPEGREFTGVVQHVLPGTGAFVRVAHDVNGLVPAAQLPGDLVKGEQLDVAVVRIDAQQRRVALRLLRRPMTAGPRPTTGPENPATAFPRVGDLFDGEVACVKPEGSGGFLLLGVEGLPRKVLLHCTAMSKELRADLNSGQIQLDELISVRVLTADPRSGRVTVEEVPDPAEAPELAPAA